jgi:hypothetical protein
VTSSASTTYNCIAWAAEDVSAWWWPVPEVHGYYWPPGVSRDVTVPSFIKAFEMLGYHAFPSDALEPGIEKVAIYADADSVPTHAARQLASGSWTSKLGQQVDIEHTTLAALEGGIYGQVVQIMCRPRTEAGEG